MYGFVEKTARHIRPKNFSIRIFDILASIAAIVILSPVFAAIIAAIRLEDGGPAFFFQERVGMMGRPFRIIKFRSMIVGAERKGAGLFVGGEDDSRITRTGAFLRRTSLDELPQLVNILRGDMSIVGPRPGMASHLEQYTKRQALRLTVKPGLTGLAQISGRNSLSWPERIENDLAYIEKRSLAFNIWIILRTVPSLLRTDGLYAPEENFTFGPGEQPGAQMPWSGAASGSAERAASGSSEHMYAG